MFTYDRVAETIAGLRSKRLFFIGGCMKSGTTWLQLMLDSHPEISCNGEGHFVDGLALALGSGFDRYNRYITGKNNEIFGEMQGYPSIDDDGFLYVVATAASYALAMQSKGKDVPVVGEKTPNNIEYCPLLTQLFPGAKFIHIVRDGRDCAVSAWFHNQRVSPDWSKEKYTTLPEYLDPFIAAWINSVQAGVEFSESHPEQYCEVRYEDLIADPAPSVTRMLSFLGVSSSAAAVERCCTKGQFEALSGGRRPGQESKASFFRKGTIGDWRNHFDDAMNARFFDQAGALLTRFGYSRD
ncbi:MAG: sulfotransferase [Azospirillaceae bacterium]|nr:sulfotransferase [Azospirillaceae bacterium]